MKLLSVGKLIDYNCNVLFTTTCILQDTLDKLLRQNVRSTTCISWSLVIFIHRHMPQWVSPSPPIYGIIGWDIYLPLRLNSVW